MAFLAKVFNNLWIMPTFAVNIVNINKHSIINYRIMKKIMMMAVAAMMVTMSAHAQFEPGKWSLDFQLGLGVSYLTGQEKLSLNNNLLDKQVRAIASAQVGVSYQVVAPLSLSAAVGVGVAGGDWENLKDGNTRYEQNGIDLTYLQIPVMAHLYIYKGLAINVGVQPSFLLNGDLTQHVETKLPVEGRNRKVYSDIRTDLSDDLNTFDFSIPMGISYEFKKHFYIGAQYNLGLSTVNKKGYFSSKDMHNGLIQLTFGYKVGLN